MYIVPPAHATLAATAASPYLPVLSHTPSKSLSCVHELPVNLSTFATVPWTSHVSAAFAKRRLGERNAIVASTTASTCPTEPPIDTGTNLDLILEAWGDGGDGGEAEGGGGGGESSARRGCRLRLAQPVPGAVL